MVATTGRKSLSKAPLPKKIQRMNAGTKTPVAGVGMKGSGTKIGGKKKGGY